MHDKNQKCHGENISVSFTQRNSNLTKCLPSLPVKYFLKYKNSSEGRLHGKTRLRSDLLCIEWDVEPYTLTHSPRTAVSASAFMINTQLLHGGIWTWDLTHCSRLRVCSGFHDKQTTAVFSCHYKALFVFFSRTSDYILSCIRSISWPLVVLGLHIGPNIHGLSSGRLWPTPRR